MVIGMYVYTTNDLIHVQGRSSNVDWLLSNNEPQHSFELAAS